MLINLTNLVLRENFNGFVGKEGIEDGNFICNLKSEEAVVYIKDWKDSESNTIFLPPKFFSILDRARN